MEEQQDHTSLKGTTPAVVLNRPSGHNGGSRETNYGAPSGGGATNGDMGWWGQKDAVRIDSEYLLQGEVTDVLRWAVEGGRSGASEGPRVRALSGWKMHRLVAGMRNGDGEHGGAGKTQHCVLDTFRLQAAGYPRGDAGKVIGYGGLEFKGGVQARDGTVSVISTCLPLEAMETGRDRMKDNERKNLRA